MKVLRYVAFGIGVLALLLGSAWFWALHTTSGARWLLGQAEAAVGLQVRSVAGDVAGGLELRGLRFTNESVEVSVAALAAEVDIDVLPPAVDIVSASASGVGVIVSEGETDDAPAPEIAAVLQGLVLPLPIRVSDLQVVDLGVSASGIDEHIDALRLAGSWYETIVVERLDVAREEISAELSGNLDLSGANPYTVNLGARLPPGLTRLPEAVSLVAQAKGDPDGVEYEATLGTFATASGSVRWKDEFVVLAGIILDQFDLSDIVSEWPKGFPVSGEIRATLDDERLAVSDTLLEINGTDARVLVDANFDRVTEEIDGHLRWEHLRWPLPRREARVHSDFGDVRLQGTPDDWRVDGSNTLRADDIPQGRFVVAGTGTRDGVEGRIIDSEVLGGHAAGKAAYSWVGTRPWSADLALRGVRLDALLPDWPAVVSGRVEGEGTFEPLEVRATLHEIDGQVRELDIVANGIVEYGAGGFIARNVRLEHGASRVDLDGALMQQDGLSIDGLVADVGVYTDAASGEIALTGRASLAGTAPALEAVLSSPALAVGDREFTGLQLLVEASEAGQSVAVSGAHLDTGFAFSAAGAFDDWSAPLDSRFAGSINGLEIDLADDHALRLEAEAPLVFSAGAASLQDFCIVDQVASRLCVNAAWKRDGEYTVDLQLGDMPLTVIEQFVDTGLHFDQHVGGSFSWRHDASGTGGNGKLHVSAGTVSPLDDPDSKVATGDGRLDFVIRDGQLLRGDIELPLPNRGHIEGDFALLDVTQVGNSEITGNIDVDIFNIRVLSKLSPYLDSASGALRAKVAIAGTVSQPAVTGDLVIEEGRFVYLPIGLDVADVNLTGTLDSDRRFDLSGTFRAGDGYGELVSSADYSVVDEPGLHFSLRGKDLTLIDVPDVLIKVDPDVDIVLSRDMLTVNGEVTVPRALIKPTNLAAGRVNESEDVVVVAGELPDPPEEEITENGLQYEGELRVILGSDIVVDLDVAKANVTGDALFDWQGDVIPIADGRYLIGGNIAAFGQVLEIVEGSVHFPKVPADQPFIRIKAEREIFGNTAVKRAGVLIDGPARRPTVEAYTLPLTTEERALTLLVTGSDFDYEQGVGAIDFGTYIAPRLFVSYGVGVFERENIISARFDLAKGFGIKASSGSKESGIDLNYRFEN